MHFFTKYFLSLFLISLFPRLIYLKFPSIFFPESCKTMTDPSD